MRLHLLSATLSLALAGFGHGFVVPAARLAARTGLSESSEQQSDTESSLTPEEEETVGNLVANEEWAGLSMELAEVVTTAVVEDLKKNSRYKVGKYHVQNETSDDDLRSLLSRRSTKQRISWQRRLCRRRLQQRNRSAGEG